jgi:hypothetical protein
MAPAGCELIDMQVVKHYKNVIIAYITYIIHIIACGNTISQTLPAKTS